MKHRKPIDFRSKLTTAELVAYHTERVQHYMNLKSLSRKHERFIIAQMIHHMKWRGRAMHMQSRIDNLLNTINHGATTAIYSC